MQRRGYRTICVADDVYSDIQKKVKEINCNPECIKHLIKKKKRQSRIAC